MARGGYAVQGSYRNGNEFITGDWANRGDAQRAAERIVSNGGGH